MGIHMFIDDSFKVEVFPSWNRHQKKNNMT